MTPDETKVIEAAREWYAAGRAADATWQANVDGGYGKEASFAHANAVDRLYAASESLRAAVVALSKT